MSGSRTLLVLAATLAAGVVRAEAQLPDPKAAARQSLQPGVVPTQPSQTNQPAQSVQPAQQPTVYRPDSYRNPEVERKLFAIMFPKFFVKDKPVKDFAKELEAASKQADPEGKGVTFEVVDEAKVRPITIEAENIPMSHLLMRMVQATGNSCFIQETQTGVRIVGW
jgi:hypothetical protein